MPSPPPELVNVALVREQRTRVRDLRGFRKGHQIPTEANDHTNGFIARIASEDLSQDLESRFSDFRTVLKFRRVDLQVTEPEGGIGQISTPWFDYQIIARVADDDPSEVVWRRQLSEFRKPEELFTSAVSSAFGSLFDTVELIPAVPIDLASFIDRIEEEEPGPVSLNYDRNVNWCHVSLAGVMGQVRLTADRVSLVVMQPQPPGKLLEAFLLVRKQLFALMLE